MEKLKYLLYYLPQHACTETAQLISRAKHTAERNIQGWRSQLQHSPCCTSFQVFLQDMAWAKNRASGCLHVCGRPSTDLQVHLVIRLAHSGKKNCPVLLLKEASCKSSEEKTPRNISVYLLLKIQ